MKRHREFQYIYKKGKSAHANSCVLFYLSHNEKKVGFTATKKVGNAVVRNRCKRRLRALFLEFSDSIKEGTYIFVAKGSTHTINFSALETDFRKILKKSGALLEN